VWLISAWLISGAAVVWGTLLRGGAPYSSPYVSWWAFAPLIFVTEGLTLRLASRRTTPFSGISDGAVVFGLFFVAPVEMLAGLALGGVAASLTRRPFRVATSVFVVAQFALFSGATVVVFRLLAPANAALDWRSWVAAGVAVAVGVTGRMCSEALTIPHLRSAMRGVLEDFALGGLTAVSSACVGVLAVVLLRLDAFALMPLVLLAAAAAVLYRRLIRERQLRQAAEFLHGADDALQSSRELETAIVQLLRRARTMFSAEVAQLTIFPTAAGEKALRTTVRHDQADEVMIAVDLGQLDDVLEAETDGVIVDRRASPSAAEMLRQRGVDEALVGLLRGESRMLGSLLVGGHMDARTFDTRDLQLFQTLANQTTTTLENGRLEQSIARLTELQEQLTHQAFHDSLTDLANRSLFGDRIDSALVRSARAGKRLAVLFIDLDDFKGVNDTLGHAAGDALLVGVAERLRGCLRRPDMAARLGGDEFAILLEELEEPAEAEIVAKRIFEALKATFDVAGHPVHVRASVGLAVADKDGDNASNLMRHADVAMYAAKAAGKDRCVVFAPGMEADIVSRHKLRSDLDVALSTDQLVIHYQPIVDLVNGEVDGLEALVRWRHPHRGLVGPAEFIPTAEETGQILMLGDFVLRRACATLLRWQARFPRATPLTMSVNISARQLQQPMFVESVVETVREIGLRPESLVLELTESILLTDAASSIAKLETLQRAGIRVAIDDFGTGYSSLSYLRRLPVDILKIAKPFVDDLALAEPNGDFARAIVGIGTALRLSLIAEGIEAAGQITRLRELGCTHGQGYYLCHPVSAEEMEEILDGGGIPPNRLGEGEHAEPDVIQLRRSG